MRAAGILLLAFGGLTLYWVVTGKGKSGSGPALQILSSPLNALGEPAGQGLQTLSSTGLTPPSAGFTVPTPTTPNLGSLGTGQANSGATALDPTQQLLQGP